MGDGRSGSTKLFGPNLATMNHLLEASENEQPVPTDVGDTHLLCLVCDDVSCLRHGEHLANSGWCCCSRDFALRTVPQKPNNFKEMHEALKVCHQPTVAERDNWSHNPVPGEEVPRPCTRPGCTFAHDREATRAEYLDLLAREDELAKDTSKAGKSRFEKFRMAHARTHGNVQPGKYGKPLLRHNMSKQILEALHLAKLGVPKIAWKHGIMNNACI